MTTNSNSHHRRELYLSGVLLFFLLFFSQPVVAQPPLEGTWVSGNNSGLIFKGTQYQVFENGQIVDKGSFSLQENILTAQSQVSNETIQYLFQRHNDVLTLQDAFGEVYQFRLSSKGGGIGSLPQKQNQNTPNQAAGSGTSAQVVKFLTGTWKDIRSSGHTIIEIHANGTFSYYSDATASGDYSNQYGKTGSWGYGNQNSINGQWQARGNSQKGTIYYQSQNGEQGTLDYQVMNENGQTYWNECYFNGTLYQRQ